MKSYLLPNCEEEKMEIQLNTGDIKTSRLES